MKFVIVLFAAMAVASAYPGIIPYHAPVSLPQPEAWPAPAPEYVKVAQPTYIKVASAPLVKVSAPQVHAPEVHQVLQIPQQQSIPPPHPQPLNIKIPHVSVSRIPYHVPKIGHPHLIGVEEYSEPILKTVAVKVPAPSHHPWD